MLTHWSLVAILILAGFLSLFFFIRTWLTEPGIIPKCVMEGQYSFPEPTVLQRRVAGLMVSVRKNRVDYITNALQMIPGMINESNIEGRTLLHLTALMNKPDIAHLLLPYHPDFSIRDIYGLQAIHYCAFSNAFEVYSLLCKELGIPESEWETKREEYCNEVRSLIPQYDFVRNVFYLTRDGIYYENQDISAFFESNELISSMCDEEEKSPQTLPTSPSQTHQSTSNLVRQTNYICLYRNHIISIPFCKDCKRFIPPRGYHCRHCGICVRVFDHHCPWVANCVGYRNHRFFVWFLVFGVLSCISGMVIMSVFFVTYILNLLDEGLKIEFWRMILDTWPCILYSVECVVFIAPLLNLAIYHCRISARNMTTHEEIILPSLCEVKDSTSIYEQQHMYSEGCSKDLRSVLFSRVPPSLAVISGV
ncbi:putative protein s-acyltransferase [Blastocystis sp. subtype 4]|uniref:putative protein s-acyltransferase n=1 Tax=Blastocystis sp. subtype 4 TaxID=944170 RepID=UPI00071179E2|nr:putative protein s-acyltransferase [Blastocystis sp. subtype 4]KNB45983.1 putative protein s-acyltransferase [Blastocystis sp. subtype 4]|eukprot:XP_014529426.1 putative protein s-acyltransferase [Blastocystis sp. subtype 4]